ncbi:MAG: 50S ribosomal protein L22 [Actinomycetota bacterium]
MAHKIAADAQEALATARFIRMSPTKARQVVDIIRGRHVDDARRVLRFNERGATDEVGKVLESAIANAEHNRGLPGDELVVARAWVDEGPTLKRFRPRAQGRATRIRKRTCHISIVVGRPAEFDALLKPPAEDEKPARGRRKTGDESASPAKTTAKQTAARVKKDSGAKPSAKKGAPTAASAATEASPPKISKTAKAPEKQEGEEA